MPNFKLVMEPEFINVCFWYIPESLRGNENNNHYHELLHKVSKKVIFFFIKDSSIYNNTTIQMFINYSSYFA